MYIQPQTDMPMDNQAASKPCSDTSLPVLRTLGVQKAVNHTAHHQLSGWISTIDACCRVLTNSPIGRGMLINSQMVASKLQGALTDHAADQKRFRELIQHWKNTCDRKTRAISALKEVSVEAQLDMLSSYLDDAANKVGDWRTLPAEEQAALMHDAWLALALQTGETEFQRLNSDTWFDVNFFAWTGCCMHKELNAVKGASGKSDMLVRTRFATLDIRAHTSGKLGTNYTWKLLKITEDTSVVSFVLPPLL